MDGALRDEEMGRTNCYYEGMFYDGRACYVHHLRNSQDTRSAVCDGNAFLYYDFAS